MKLISSLKNKLFKNICRDNLSKSDIIRKRKLKKLKKKYSLNQKEDSEIVMFHKYNMIDFTQLKLEQRTYMYLRKLTQKYDIFSNFIQVIYELIIFCQKYNLELEYMSKIIVTVINKFIMKNQNKYDETFVNFINTHAEKIIELIYLLLNKKIVLKEHFNCVSILPYIFI